MSLREQAIGLAIGGAVIALGIWYVKRKASSALSSAGSAISSTASSAWNTATTPVLDLGTGPVGSTVADVGNGIVQAPANTLDGVSMGLISGKGGNTGDGGLAAWLYSIVNGDAFAPKSTAPDAGIDYGSGANDWSS